MAHWIDNADSYICPVCGFEVGNLNNVGCICPRCGFYDSKDVRSADVVEVVRCKDCRTYSNKVCWKMRGRMKPDDFCSYGERRTDVYE